MLRTTTLTGLHTVSAFMSLFTAILFNPSAPNLLEPVLGKRGQASSGSEMHVCCASAAPL